MTVTFSSQNLIRILTTHLAWDVAATVVGREVTDHAETSSRRRDWYVNETDLLETSL